MKYLLLLFALTVTPTVNLQSAKYYHNQTFKPCVHTNRLSPDSILTLKITKEQAFELWRFDWNGCKNLRALMADEIIEYIKNKDFKYITSKLGTPDKIHRYKNSSSVIYIVHSSCCSTCSNCSSKKLLQGSGSLLDLQFSYDSIMNQTVLIQCTQDIYDER